MTNQSKPELSKCCKAPVRTECGEDFGGPDDIQTCHWECTKCEQPCDLFVDPNDMLKTCKEHVKTVHVQPEATPLWEHEFEKLSKQHYDAWSAYVVGKGPFPDMKAFKELIKSEREAAKAERTEEILDTMDEHVERLKGTSVDAPMRSLWRMRQFLRYKFLMSDEEKAKIEEDSERAGKLLESTLNSIQEF